MSWLGVFGRAAWDLAVHAKDAGDPNEDRWIAERHQQWDHDHPREHQLNMQYQQEQQNHHQDQTAHHHDNSGHDIGHGHDAGGGW